MTAENKLEIFTVYKHPRDYPQGYVVRRQVVGGERHCQKCLDNAPHGTPAEPCALADRVAQYAPDLAGARAFIPLGKGRLPRDSSDDPAILEVWL